MRRALVAVSAFALCACKPPPAGCSLDLSTDSLNCGACGNACEAGSRCEDGRCVATCAGLRCAGDVCVEPMTDPENCGACGLACQPMHSAPVCSAGQCSHGPCERGWFDCDGDPVNGCENDNYYCLVDVCGQDATGRQRGCSALSVSADGRRVLMTSDDPGYVAGDDSFSIDFFLFEVPTRTYRRLLNVVSPDYPRAGALSGDGTRAVLITLYRAVLADLETGQLQALPGLPMFDEHDAGVEVDTNQPPKVGLSHDGRLMVRSLLSSQTEPYGLVASLESGASLLVPSRGAISISGDGRFVGVTRLIDGFPPFGEKAGVVELDGGAYHRLAQRLGNTGVSSTSPELSYDGTIAAFDSNDPAFATNDDAGFVPRVVVVAADGGISYSAPGFTPRLSHDGRRLAYSRDDSSVSTGCVVVDLTSGADLFRSSSVLPVSSFCTPFLSGDGRTLLVTFDRLGDTPSYAVPLPP